MPGPSSETLLRDTIDELLAEGASLAEVEREIIEPSALSEDSRAALWLYAWGRLERAAPPLVVA
jgi:hypothetical protein